MRVAVTEGIVSLRLQSQAERLLHAGEGWTRSEPTTDETPSAPQPASPPQPLLDVPAAPVEPPRSAEARADVSSTRPPTRAPTEESRPADAFAAGVSAFEGGDYRTADRNFVRFLAEAPGDPRVEDAAFLRAVAHARMGDRHGAAQLAQKYLTQFPSGLRRKEAERLVSHSTLSDSGRGESGAE